MLPTQDLNILSLTRLAPPRAVKDRLPMTEECNRTVVEGRATVRNILQHQDPRLLIVVGPCSVHDPKGAIEYAQKLAALREELKDRLYICHARLL
jgi:3-deoxy-7-phosphoheptulonate synthase